MHAASPVVAGPFHRLLSSFAGVPAAQVWADFLLWELVLNDNPQARAVVEIGTFRGGFARYLAAQARDRGLEFRTYDAVVPDRPPGGFVKCDVFAEIGEVMEYLEKWEPVVLLCDGGNKPRELATFGARLRPGSVVVVHDWMTEVGPENVPERMAEVYGDTCDELGSMSRIFVPVQVASMNGPTRLERGAYR